MPRPRRILLLLVAVCTVVAVAAPAAVGPASASTPPTKLCAVCGEQLETAAIEAGTPIVAGESRLRIDVARNGSGVFRARVAVNETAADRFREEPEALDALASTAFDEARYAFGVDRARGLSATVADDQDALVFTYVVPDVATESTGGVLLVTAFGERGNYVEANVDEVHTYGPDGWSVANRPATGIVERVGNSPGGTSWQSSESSRERVVWRGDAHYDARAHLDRGTYVAFAPDDGLAASANAELAVASHIGPMMLEHAFVAGAPSAFVLAVTLAFCGLFVGGTSQRGRSAHQLTIFGVGTVVLGLAWALFEGQNLFRTTNLALFAIPVGIAAFAALSERTHAVSSTREAALRVLGTVGVGGAVAATIVDTYLATAAIATSAAVCGCYLFAVTDDRRLAATIAAATVLVPIAAMLPNTPVGGFGPVFAAIILTPPTLLAALLGILAYRLGAGTQISSEGFVESKTSAQGQGKER